MCSEVHGRIYIWLGVHCTPYSAIVLLKVQNDADFIPYLYEQLNPLNFF